MIQFLSESREKGRGKWKNQGRKLPKSIEVYQKNSHSYCMSDILGSSDTELKSHSYFQL